MKFIGNEPTEIAKQKAKTVGLDKIDFDETYQLVKVGAKNPSPYGYPSHMVALPRGQFSIATHQSETDGQMYVWLVGFWINGDSFKTSPIVSCQKTNFGFSIETQNSTYELRYV